MLLQQLLIILIHLDFPIFLDLDSVKEFSEVSTSCFCVVEQHIAKQHCFELLFGPEGGDSTFPIKIYKTLTIIHLHQQTRTKQIQTTTGTTQTTRIIYGLSYNLQNFPTTITHITFNSNFNKNVKILPQQLTHIEFGDKFNQPVDNLPKQLKFVVFGGNFNQNLDNLPTSLKSLLLVCCSKFKHNLDSLPTSLNYFRMSFVKRMLDVGIDNLPQQLTQLELIYIPTKSLDYIPNSVKKLYAAGIPTNLDNLPDTITHITLDILHPPHLDNLPNNLTHLTLICDTSKLKLDHLPNKLTHLQIRNITVNLFLDHLPESLTHLTIDYGNHNCLDHLPTNLTHLKLSDQFSNCIDNLPTKLTHLVLGKSFYHRIDNLPASLKQLIVYSQIIFDCSYLSPLTKVIYMQRY